ncbi:serine/threonine protein kinase [Patescibacteria group bacterium]|nr:serine/threonine protein kinase [Patescibacteria group bacterium]MBP9709486.1 serine/threonine protein kinase [Patescibacteria group bacterium]
MRSREEYIVKTEELAIGPYTIHGLLGSGGMCNVHLGIHKTTHEPVAVKRIQLGLPAHCYPRLDVEAAILRALLHHRCPYLVEYIEYGTDTEDRKALVIELVKNGVTLDQFVAEQPHKRLPPLLALHILKCVAEGMAAAHALGIVHRDLKSDNVLIVYLASGVILRVAVIDFGLAKADPSLYAGERLTPVPAVFGTMEYMSPEQYTDTSGVDARTDVYAMALLLYYLITGKDYYPRVDRAAKEAYTTYLERTREKRRSPPKTTPDIHIPPAVWRLIRLGISFDLNHRPKDALAFLKLLQTTMRTLRRDTDKKWPINKCVSAQKKPRPVPTPPKKKLPLPVQPTHTPFLTRKQILELVVVVFVAFLLAITLTNLIFLPASR